jgi:hypothetical protein
LSSEKNKNENKPEDLMESFAGKIISCLALSLSFGFFLCAPFAPALENGSAAVRDLWAKKDLGKSAASFATKVPSHGVAMLRIIP